MLWIEVMGRGGGGGGLTTGVTYTVRPRKNETHKSSCCFSENCNDLSEKVYIVTKLNMSSFF